MNVPVSGKFYGAAEQDNLDQCKAELLMGVSSEHWMHEFELKFRDFLGVRFSAFCNSGSSANLLALSALSDADTPFRIKPGVWWQSINRRRNNACVYSSF